jgi:hypothetical protein
VVRVLTRTLFFLFLADALDMNFKKFRHFLFGFLFGAGGVYWYSLYGEYTLNVVLAWLQYEADAYLAEHPAPKVDTGWRTSPSSKP